MQKTAFIILGLVVSAFAGSLFFGNKDQALAVNNDFNQVPQTSSDIAISEDERNQNIVQNCTAIKSKLEQLQQSDHLLRVNRGSLYESFSSKLMSRFNGRLAYNNYDASVFMGITASYDRQVADFRSSFQEYDRQLKKLKQIDCRKKPIEFYNQLVTTREARKKLHSLEVGIRNDLVNYRQQTSILMQELKNNNLQILPVINSGINGAEN